MAHSTEEPTDYADRLRLDGRHVLVLGGGLGIGHQTAAAASALGANVTVVDTDAERAKRVADEVGGLALVGDATRRADVERVVSESVDRFGPLHGLADIIGISTFASIEDSDDDVFDRGIALNLRHVYLAVQIGARAMTDGGGSIALVGSISGTRSAPKHAIYGAAKAAVSNLAASAAVELGPQSIRVNVVAPGQTYTPRIAERHPEAGYYDEASKLVPLGRVGMPDDIASALLFFLSPLSGWVTGQTLVVDGGTGSKYPYPMGQ
ncbi:NAD(P)-dependent dehydrogenase (short-subunit alcohol dehydrogenase family) [Prauserella sediminis]|uniref:NAD(P)-dependent dehydrogenase (Short-subunit alcohol dehydrogenase family) n=1 Tax=Prauserella sediminis TaxID=577680 RepID=A0A839XYV6_9PSEU|nr:SDR family oxidoreductase [Prauserella sediminis]MBB3665593.1 NAD(P)-dependent dehydrogenase (short-subunit alcohol dehydrogenase family) [Prauserella sediminis]